MSQAPSTPDSMTGTFVAVPAKPDHVAIEHHILDVWERERTFERLRERTAGGPVFSFIDGPITANNPMGVHHAWGRTLKDIYQRWFALRGFDQRYQNGFDCQGLWVEVEVEKALSLNSKQEIEAYGLDQFSRACRDRVAKFSEVQTTQSKRLGQWMDWDNDYYTLSDTNISYIWMFLAECHRRNWLYVGHRPMTWCPRCGTSLSQHELIDSYADVTHPSLHVRFPLIDESGADTGEGVMVWTTTPWTLPANVAAAVKPDATYALVARDGGDVWMVRERVTAVFGDDAQVIRETPGHELVGARYRGPFAELPSAEGADYRVVGWDDVSTDDGTGIVHIAPGCGAEDNELGAREGLHTIMPVNESGVFTEPFGFLEGLTTHDAAPVVIEELTTRGMLVRSGTIEHRYPSCWRCGTELIFRLVDEWFIRCDEIREPMIEANRSVEWSPSFYGKRMEDWLNNMGDWCISRKRYWGLPLPFYRDPEQPDGEIFVVESLEHLREVAVDPAAVDALPELHRPWIDDIKVRHPETGRVLERVTEVGDCWLDAGIVPFATLGWKNPERIAGGYATGASSGLSNADLPSHEEWERWFPADMIVEMREQIRLWFYSLLFMSVVLEGRAPYKRVLAYEKVHDETGRAMHKSWGNAIWFDDAAEKMGADVMRWQYAQQTPSQNLNFGYGPANEIKRKFLTLWNVYGFFVQYANVDGWKPEASMVEDTGSAGIGLGVLQVDALQHPLDRWLAARTHALVAESHAAFDRWDTCAYTRAVERYIEDLSNWYVRRSRRRFWKAELGEADRDSAYTTLWGALVTTARVLAPVMPFLAEELWGNLVGSAATSNTPDSVHLATWPVYDASAAEHTLLTEVDAVQRIVGLARAARSAAKLKLRQPLRELVVFRRRLRGTGTSELAAMLDGHVDDMLAELSIKQVTLVDEPGERWTEGLMPLLPKLGPKYGADIAKIRAAVAAADIDILDDGRARVGDFTLESDEYEHRSGSGDGWSVAEDHEWVVAVSTELDEDLVVEGIAREAVRALQNLRKDSGLDITDRIGVVWRADGRLARALREHHGVIAEEVLATRFEEGSPEDAPHIIGDVQFDVGGDQAVVAITRM
jgi:isoleucyl-tRNA synthetase